MTRRYGPFTPAARRLGIQVERAIPVAPEPAVDFPEEPTEDELEFLAWRAIYGGTFPEFICWRWLVKRRHLIPNVDFIFQSSQLGGRAMPGGAVVDFDFPSRLLAWRVQGLFFHVGDASVEMRDDIQKLALSAALNYTVIDLFEDDVQERTEFALSRALEGIQTRER